jgi:hypothetical protein
MHGERGIPISFTSAIARGQWHKLKCRIAVLMAATLGIAANAQQYQIAFQCPLGAGTITFDTNRLVVMQSNLAGTWFFDPQGTLVFQGTTNLNSLGVSLRVNAFDAVYGAGITSGPVQVWTTFEQYDPTGGFRPVPPAQLIVALERMGDQTVTIYRNVQINGLSSGYDSFSIAPYIGPPAAPLITSEPQTVLINAHSNTSFHVAASGTYPLSYLWMLNDSNILSAVTVSLESTLSITNAKQASIGGYKVVVTNSYGASTSVVANLDMYPFLAQPFTGAITYWGQTNVIAVDAWGTGPLNFQWLKNGTAVPGGTNATLALPSIQFTDAGSYSLVVSNAFGSVTNIPYEIIVNSANVSLGTFPGVIINGTVGYNYVIQSTLGLAEPATWKAVTNITLMSPQQIWNDNNTDISKAGNPRKFYRVVPGP